jgi:hypothetical protein
VYQKVVSLSIKKEVNNEYRHCNDSHSRGFHSGPGRWDVIGSSKLLSLRFRVGEKTIVQRNNNVLLLFPYRDRVCSRSALFSSFKVISAGHRT